MPFITISEFLGRGKRLRPVTFSVPNLSPSLSEILSCLVAEEARNFAQWLKTQSLRNPAETAPDIRVAVREASCNIAEVDWDRVVSDLWYWYQKEAFVIFKEETKTITVNEILTLDGDISLLAKGWYSIWHQFLAILTGTQKIVEDYMFINTLSSSPERQILRFTDDGHKDPYPIHENNPLAQAHLNLKQFIEETLNPVRGDGSWDFFLSFIRQASKWPELARPDSPYAYENVVAGLKRLVWYKARAGEINPLDIVSRVIYERCRRAIVELIKAIHGSNLNLAEDQLVEILTLLERINDPNLTPVSEIAFGFIKGFLPGREFSMDFLYRVLLMPDRERRIEKLLSNTYPLGLSCLECWASEVAQSLRDMNEPQRDAWLRILGHNLPEGVQEPDERWLDEARANIAGVGEGCFRDCLNRWLPLVSLRWSPGLDRLEQVAADRMITDRGASVLNILIWHSSILFDKDLQDAIERLARSCYLKVQGGPLAVSVANSCCRIIAARRITGCNDALERILQVCSHVSTSRFVKQKIVSLGNTRNQTKDDLAELMALDFGIDEHGIQRRPIGGGHTEIHVLKPGRPEAFWVDPEGKRKRGIPAVIRRNNPQEIWIHQKDLKGIEDAFVTHRMRMERFWLALKQACFLAPCQASVVHEAGRRCFDAG